MQQHPQRGASLDFHHSTLTKPLALGLCHFEHDVYVGFAYYLPSSAEAAVMVVNNPLTHQLDIQRFNAQGFIMRTRSDEGMIRVPRKENDATKSAAQIMSIDFYSGPSIVLI